MSGISLEEYIRFQTLICEKYHQDECCSGHIAAAKYILECQPVKLSEVWSRCYSERKYKTYTASRTLGRMPVVLVTLSRDNKSSGKNGNQVVYVLEKEESIDYSMFFKAFDKLGTSTGDRLTAPCISKERLKLMASMASSERDKRLIKYVATSHLSAGKAKQLYGMSNHRPNKLITESALYEVMAIRSAYESLIYSTDRAFLSSESGAINECDSSTDDEETDDEKTDDELDNTKQLSKVGRMDEGLIEETSEIAEDGEDASAPALIIDTSSDSDSNDDWASIASVEEPAFRLKIMKKRNQLKKKARREWKRKVNEERLLKRKIRNKTKNLIHRHPNIGAIMERLVRESGVGADKWRSSGSLTWERKKVGQKMTFRRLRECVQKEIGESVSHGTLVELCVPRNKRNKSSVRYKSAANIVSKRARKGFDIKINPDEKWSNSLYKSLDSLQKTDHSNALYINRDDAAGFRLDTLATAGKFATLMLRDDVDQGTHTDFTNKEQNVLQVSSYYFGGSKTSEDNYAGVVKCVKIDAKNAGQHVSDLEMLRENPTFRQQFFKKDGCEKDIDFIRVDGGGDESPSHMETQFMWTEWHIERSKLATIVTTRYSGGSF